MKIKQKKTECAERDRQKEQNIEKDGQNEQINLRNLINDRTTSSFTTNLPSKIVLEDDKAN